MNHSLDKINTLEVGKTYTYKQMCEALDWKISNSTTSNSAMSQLKIVDCYYSFTKTKVGNKNAIRIEGRRVEPLPLPKRGQEKRNLTIQFNSEEEYMIGLEIVKEALQDMDYRILKRKS